MWAVYDYNRKSLDSLFENAAPVCAQKPFFNKLLEGNAKPEILKSSINIVNVANV